MSRNISQNNRKVKITSERTYNPDDPNDALNILKANQQSEFQKLSSANNTTHEFRNLIPKKEITKNTQYPQTDFNAQHQEKQIEEYRDKRSISGNSTFSRQIGSRVINHPQPTQEQSRPHSQNKKIIFREEVPFKAIIKNYFPVDQHQQNNNNKTELTNYKDPIYSNTSRISQQDDKEELQKQIIQRQLFTQRNEFDLKNQNVLQQTFHIQPEYKQQNNQQQIEQINREIQQNASAIDKKYNHLSLIQKPDTQQQQKSDLIQIEYKYDSKSAIKSPNKICNYCRGTKINNLISLPCNHQFHTICLQLMMDYQVSQQQPIIQCKCQAKIPQRIVKIYLTKFQLQIYYQIQVQFLPKLNHVNFKWKRCPNYSQCDFIFLELESSIKTKSKCPNCIENILAQSIARNFDKCAQK